ncbi:hypothetical protein [Cellulomonas sp. ATA003]|uniref:hypothetical protein n=1 Tax=Cellulomonas sp. ATA003 TaxID=3073064 RepID=UPI0028736B81|nr:hypothetical protein [Cellulomonas sp. ATA003]WNB85433.1 hypothetical protein REH70_17915 [Cellulomonas sp. ATA003]
MVIVLVAIWRRPLVAAVLVASVVPATAGLDRGLVVPELKISEILLVLCLAPLVFRRTARWRRINSIDIALLTVAVTGLALEVANGLNADNLALDMLLRSGLFPAFTFATWWVASRGVSDRRDVDTVLRWVLLVSVVPATLGILQYLDVLGVRAALSSVVDSGLLPEPGGTFSRVTGPFTIAHSFGGYLLVPLIIGAVLLLGSRSSVLGRRALATVVAVDAAALVLSVTITTLLWAVAAFLIAATMVQYLRRALAALVSVALLAGLVFWPALADRWQAQTTPASGTAEGAVPQTFQFRILVWQRDYLPLLAEAAPAGLNIGPGDVVFTSTENQYISLILRGGVVLLLATAASLVVLARRAAHAARVEPEHTSLPAAAIFGILVFLPVACIAWPYVTNAGLPQSLFGVAGAVLAMAGTPPGGHWAPGVATVRR